MKSQTKSKIVYVAMSGGVDSSVAAALLKKQGYDVTGVFMKPWSPSAPNSRSQILNSKQILNSEFCMWKEDREDAMRAAAVLEIPFLTWDFSREYKKEVGDYMIREYRAGRTPNPDVMCNKEIKFGLFLKKALAEGADYIATGHYARLKREILNPKFEILNKSEKNQKSKNKEINFRLLKAKDENKDQSYFLWTLDQEQLKYCLFPIGDYVKPDVRKLAKKFGLPNHDKKDSQGVCFIGPLDMKEFLKKYIKPKKGKIILHGHHAVHGAHVIGEHDGSYYYTIGQRHGLDIKNGQGPYYVIGKDLKKNIVYVGEESDLGGKEAKIMNINWINPTWKLNFQVNGSMEVDVKIRYRSKSEKAILYKNGSLKFKNLIRAITPGQSAVFYKSNEILGGGIIRPRKSNNLVRIKF